ncbi:hypothetical protein G6F68_021597 [Rhizopus microsporus]|nr:hypothetical protein G6F68_021597 [Rhizopus microsporus]
MSPQPDTQRAAQEEDAHDGLGCAGVQSPVPGQVRQGGGKNGLGNLRQGQKRKDQAARRQPIAAGGGVFHGCGKKGPSVSSLGEAK